MTERRMRLLITEDSAESLEQLAAILSGDYDLSVALSGAEALELAAKVRPDLILLDIMMPGMDGYAVCRSLKENPRTRSIPVIFVTALHEAGDERRGFAVGAVDFITKPYTPELVLARVRTHLDLYSQSRHLESLVLQRTRELAMAKQEAENANQAKTRFLANMSHELRTPLNGVLGIAQLLEADELTEDQHELLGDLIHAGQGLLRIVNDLLALSNMEFGFADVSPEAVSLRDLFQPLASAYGMQAQNKQLEFTATISPNLPERVFVDQQRLSQVLSKLLDNALKFTRSGTIALSAEPSPGPEADRILFQVADTGLGIAEDRLESIFERFAIAENYLTKQYGGSGLGLSIARELAEAMGGEITVRSTLGRGSRFTVSLPCVLAPAAPGEDSEEEHAPGPSLRVLLVEDEPISRMMTSRMLTLEGHVVGTAENGRLAVEALGAQSFDLVLMDVQMPEMNGLDAVRLIRSGQGVSDPGVPIIGLSAYATDQDIGTAMQAGFDDYLCKPCDPQTLGRAIRKALDRK